MLAAIIKPERNIQEKMDCYKLILQERHVKYLPVALAVISSPVFAQQFSYVEVGHASYASDFGLNFSSNLVAASVEIDKNMAVFASYERSGKKDYSDVADLLSEGFDIDANMVTSNDTATITFLDPARTSIAIPINDTYSDSDATIGLRAFNEISKNASAYIDLKYHKESVYKSEGKGFGTRFGIRFSPIPAFSGFKIGAYGDYTLTNIGSVKLGTTADRIALNLTKRSAGLEAIFNIKQFTLGASAEHSQLIHAFSVKSALYDNFNENFTDAYRSSQLFVQYHFK